MLLEAGSSCEGLEWLALTACSCVCWDPCSLSRDAPFSLSCPCNQENRHKTTRGHLFQELLSFLFGPVCTWSVYLAEEFLMKLPPARGATSLLVTWFPVSLSPLCLCSLCPRFPSWMLCITSVCLQCAEDRLLLFLYCSWRLIGLFLCDQICLSEGERCLCVTQEWWTSSGQHLLCASERVLCICSKEDSVFLMPFKTQKEEVCKLTRF